MIATLPILDPDVEFRGQRRRWFRRRGRLHSLVRQDLWLADPHCRYCRRPLAGPWAGVLDHAVPRSRGGSDYACNAVLSCRACDRAKGAMTIDEWRAALLAGLFTI